MSTSKYDVSVIWRWPFWPITLAVIVAELVLVPLALSGNVNAQIIGPVLVVAWLAIAVGLNARIIRRRELAGEAPQTRATIPNAVFVLTVVLVAVVLYVVIRISAGQ